MLSLLGEYKIERLLEFAKRAPANGIFIEVGVYKGGSLLALAKAFPERQLVGFDTFEGMPAQYAGRDESHPVGDFADTSVEAVRALFDAKQVTIIKGLFPDPAGDMIDDLGDYFIAFAHLDMDHWRGTLEALTFIWPRLLPGGVIVFDDYNWRRCPGIAPLVQTWAKAHGLQVEEAGLQACIVKAGTP